MFLLHNCIVARVWSTYVTMACKLVTDPPPSLLKKKGNPPSSKIFDPPLRKLLNSPQFSNFLQPPSIGNKQDVKLTHKRLIEHKKTTSEIWRNIKLVILKILFIPGLYAILIFPLKSYDPFQQNYFPQQYNPPTHHINISDPLPSKYFTKVFNPPPPAGNGVPWWLYYNISYHQSSLDFCWC